MHTSPNPVHSGIRPAAPITKVQPFFIHYQEERAMPMRECNHPWEHGYRGTLTWNSWRAMKQRAGTKPGYDHVQVCARWAECIQCMVADIGKRVHRDFTIHRRDPLGPYDVTNATWAPWSVQGYEGKLNDLLQRAMAIDLFEPCGLSVEMFERLWGVGACDEVGVVCGPAGYVAVVSESVNLRYCTSKFAYQVIGKLKDSEIVLLQREDLENVV